MAVINRLHARDATVRVRFVCDAAFEAQARGLMAHAAAPVTVSVIRAGKFRRYKHLTFLQHFTVPHVVIKNTTDVGKIIVGLFQSIGLLVRDRPDVVFAKGGYVCLPMGIAAWLLRVPLVIHDSDTRAGLTNRVLARFARSIATGAPLENYPYDPKKSTYVGVPIGGQFVPVSVQQQRDYKQGLGVPPDTPLIVATGGGLGAASINAAMIAVAPRLSGRSVALYNVTGKAHFEAVQAASQGLTNYRAVPFVYEHMERVLGAADIVVSRGSATFLQELAGLAKAVIIVPAKQLGDQVKNAAVYEKAQAAMVLTDDQLVQITPFYDAIQHLLDDAQARMDMAVRLHRFARPQAADDVADMIYRTVK